MLGIFQLTTQEIYHAVQGIVNLVIQSNYEIFEGKIACHQHRKSQRSIIKTAGRQGSPCLVPSISQNLPPDPDSGCHSIS
jgi:hypothetical protein